MLCIYTGAQRTGHCYHLVLSNKSEGGAGDTQIMHRVHGKSHQIPTAFSSFHLPWDLQAASLQDL
jgi:hypothetical protein